MPINLTDTQTRLNEIDEQVKSLQNEKKRLVTTVLAEHQTAIDKAYALKDEPFGTVTVSANNQQLKVTRKKKVEWSNDELALVYEQIAADDGNPAEFIDRAVEYNIPEKRYSAWSSEVRAWFDAARTVKDGGTEIEVVSVD